MSPHTLHIIAQNAPCYGGSGIFAGYGGANKRCLPCSGVFGRAVTLSPDSWYGARKIYSQMKTGSLKCFSRDASFVCRAGSRGQRRNRDIWKQNYEPLRRNRQNEDEDSFEWIDESETLTSKNGSSVSPSNSLKLRAGVAPGAREKEIVELFREVQAQLRRRDAPKEDEEIETSKGNGKKDSKTEDETVNSFIKLLRKHSTEPGERKSRSYGRREREVNGSLSKDISFNLFKKDSRASNEAKESRSPSLSRPPSNFRRKSPVPQVIYRPIYSSEESLNSLSRLNSNGKSKSSTVGSPPESKHESVFEPELEKELDSEDETELVPEAFYDKLDGIEHESEFEPELEKELDSEDEAEFEPEAIYDEKDEIELEDLSAMKVTQLKELAKSRGVKGYSKMKKGDLIELLASNQ